MRSKLLVVICLLMRLNISIPLVHAQESPSVVMLCVIPNNPEDGASYVVVFRSSTLFGFLVPISANVTVFGNQKLSAALQRVTTDAPTGGYHLGLEVARLRSDANLLNSTDCAEDIDQLSKALNISVNQNTLQIPVSAQYGLTVQLGGDDKLATPFLGVFGFQIQTATDSHVTNFQVAQISASDPKLELSLSKVTADSPATFTVIGNKKFGISKSGSANPDSFGSTADAEPFSYLKDQFGDKLPGLFDMMQAAGLPIYPDRILGYFNPQPFAGGYLSLVLDTAQAHRVPEFVPDSKVSIVTKGIEARMFLPSRPGEVFNKLTGDYTLSVVRVDDQGQLIVRTQDGQEAVIEAWRVQASEPAQ